jgi:hypothetical protein
MKNYFFLLGACIVLGSCSTGDTAGVSRMLGGSSQALAFLNCKAVSENEIEFTFSKAVTVTSVNFNPELQIASIENGSAVKVRLEEKETTPGRQITADLLAKDEKKNSINVIVPFRSRNNRMPDLVINEICTENGNSTNKRTEFIELKMKSDGNLGAMRVVIIGNSTASRHTVYEFTPCEVKNGDYVVIHLRTLEESCKNEYKGDIKESGGVNSSPLAWDFWMPENTKWIQKAATAVYVLDQDDNVLDAVMISETPETPDSEWKKDYFAEAAEFLFQQGAWKSKDGQICSPADAVISAGATNTRTICRNENAEDTNTAADWYITADRSATPGGRNNSSRYSN